MSTPKPTNKQPEETSSEDIPELARFLEAKEQLERFMESLPDETVNGLRQRIDEYNNAQEDANKTIRDKQVSAGPWQVYSKRTDIDAKVLYDEMGEVDFLRFGGSVREIKVYEVDRRVYAARVAAGDIPEEVVALVSKVSPIYHFPKKIAF